VLHSMLSNTTHPSTLQLISQQSNVDHQIVFMIFHRLVNASDAVQALDWPESEVDHLFKAGIIYIFSLGDKLLSSIIDSTPSPYHIALVRNIFCAALILGDETVLHTIMNKDEESMVNGSILISGSRYYPLEFTILKGHIQATRVLLEHGADPNWQKRPLFLSDIGRMQSSQQRNPKASVEIMRLLIRHGLEVDPRASKLQMKDCDREELFLLVTHCLNESFDTFFRQRALPIFLSRPDWDDSFLMMLEKILVQASSRRDDNRELWNSVLSESLCGAVICSHTSAIEMLLATGAVPEGNCLIAAVQIGDLRLLEDFLNRGLDPNVQVPKSYDWSKYHYEHDQDSTALSESIKSPSKGAFQLLQSRGFISDLVYRPAGFVAVLMAACEMDDGALIDRLLSLRDIPLKQENVGRAVEAAVRAKNPVILKQLLDIGIEPSVRCLQLAIQNQQLIAVELLAKYVSLPVKMQEAQSHYPNMIFEALRWGNQIVIEHLLRLEHPVDLHIRLELDGFEDWHLQTYLQPPKNVHDGWNLSPLSAAILKRNSAAVKALLDYGAQVMIPYSSNLRLTSYQSASGIRFGWALTPLAAAAIRNDFTLVKEFLRVGTDPFDNSALFVCAVLGLENITTFLLSAFRNRYPDGAQYFASDALYRTITHKNEPIFKLLANDADIIGRVTVDREPGWHIHSLPSHDTEFTTPLGEAIRLHAARRDSLGMLADLMSRVKDFNIVVHKSRKHGSMTCLLYAIELHSLETVQKLVQAGANISLPAKSNTPRTPLQAAAQSGDTEILEYLLGEGVSPNEHPAPRAGATALQLAAMVGNLGLVIILIKAGADINAQPATIDGRTAFEAATEHGRLDTMQFLVQHGADLLCDDNRQYRRAIRFAEDNLQYPAKHLADQLYSEVLASCEANFVNSCENDWADIDMTDIDEFFSYME
jgi:ankyrin repeat protein